ncbi:LysR family transcriptional regulator [Ancylobacter sp. MQZ15Z-1]|uniref:LysR family transcriptional regulator n=1 Tax=Ancylobacter mangrovi TaxID=2972472 RepID=A0A9X2PBE3_9HYPH|nr:LysR family transcriptional regulator [Ancylobacter mangrovi]MCS0495521.1 LysR family transcriptional regulator [Ancylobacter mangrovi]
MRYTLRQLEYFIAAGETGSITLASERVHISQPSISTAISHLERELGVQLFVRHHAQGLSLTAIGQNMLAEAKRLIEQAEGMYSLASEASTQVRGQINVGCVVTLAPLVMPELAHSFEAAYPGTRLHQVSYDQESLIAALRRAEVDIAVCYDLHLPGEIDFLPLASMPPQAWVGETHPLARQPATTLEELAPLPYILLDLPGSREYFLAMFMKEGLTPNITARSAHQEIVRTMVANGYGYSLANVRPRSDMALDGRRLMRLRIAGDVPALRLGLATLANFRKSRLVDAFQSHCQSFISDSYIPGMAALSTERRVLRSV